MMKKFLVVCYGDEPGRYVLATRRRFLTETAATDYAVTICDGRSPIIVEMPARGELYEVELP